MEVPSKSIHKVTLVFLKHPHNSLQLSQSEDLHDGPSCSEGHSCPAQQIHTLKGVRLQAGLPQPSPETAVKSLVFKSIKTILNPQFITLPSAC